jgi:hypothetical protein
MFEFVVNADATGQVVFKWRTPEQTPIGLGRLEVSCGQGQVSTNVTVS